MARHASNLIEATDRGLYCAAGDFHIDPWASSRPVDRAVITHAHADHLQPGHGRYLCAAPGQAIARARLPEGARVEAIAYGEPVTINGVRVSLHPAGHLLGSAQARVEHRGEVWVVSGDYKTRPDRTCEPFEPLRCDTFITESTFGLPIYRWPDEAGVFEEIHHWWRANRDAGRTSVIFAYALGKAQRVLSGLDAATGPIVVHGAVKRFVDLYHRAGVELPPVHAAGELDARLLRSGAVLVIAPPSANASPWLRRFGRVSTALASGWMRVRGVRRRRSMDRGFVLSDHVDWPALLAAIDASGASRVGVTHGYSQVLVRWLTEQGRHAFAIPTRYQGEAGAEDAADSRQNGDGGDAARTGAGGGAEEGGEGDGAS